MRLRLTPSSGVPVYRQIIDQVGYLIAGGQLQEGERLPSVRELARALPANQNTVLKAYDLLERDGLIVRRHGDGTFVAGRGSPLSLAARRRKVNEVLAQAAALAGHFELSADELHKLLDEQLRRLSQHRESRHG
jgi:GntR family transcriptional regulator